MVIFVNKMNEMMLSSRLTKKLLPFKRIKWDKYNTQLNLMAPECYGMHFISFSFICSLVFIYQNDHFVFGEISFFILDFAKL